MTLGLHRFLDSHRWIGIIREYSSVPDNRFVVADIFFVFVVVVVAYFKTGPYIPASWSFGTPPTLLVLTSQGRDPERRRKSRFLPLGLPRRRCLPCKQPWTSARGAHAPARREPQAQ